MRSLVCVKRFSNSSGVFCYKGLQKFNIVRFCYSSGNGHYCGSNTDAHCSVSSPSFDGELCKLAMLTTARKMKRNPLYFRDWQNTTFNTLNYYHTIFGEIHSCNEIEIRFENFKFQNNDVFVEVSLFYDSDLDEPGCYSLFQNIESHTSGCIHLDNKDAYLVLGSCQSPTYGYFTPKVYDDFFLSVDTLNYSNVADFLLNYDIQDNTAYNAILPCAVPLGCCRVINYSNARCYDENGDVRDWDLWIEK